jgi:hypothetical protein
MQNTQSVSEILSCLVTEPEAASEKVCGLKKWDDARNPLHSGTFLFCHVLYFFLE